jgi:hypothetical protein
MPVYSSRYVHKINPRDTDTGPDVTIATPPVPPRVTYTVHSTGEVVDCTRNALDCRAVGAILRAARLLGKGESVYEARIEPDGRIVAFPRASIWHSIILTPKPE